MALFIGVFIGVLLIDQLTKYLALSMPEQGYFVGGDAAGLKIFSNEGIAFGITVPELILYPLVILFLVLLGMKYRKELFSINNRNISIALGFIFGGALGNVIDRIFYGHVVDFINIWLGSIFNLADVFIIIGVLILIIKEFRKKPVQKS